VTARTAALQLVIIEQRAEALSDEMWALLEPHWDAEKRELRRSQDLPTGMFSLDRAHTQLSHCLVNLRLAVNDMAGQEARRR